MSGKMTDPVSAFQYQCPKCGQVGQPLRNGIPHYCPGQEPRKLLDVPAILAKVILGEPLSVREKGALSYLRLILRDFETFDNKAIEELMCDGQRTG